jgi:transketolase
MFENMEMRAVFGAELEKLMAADERIVLVDADLSKANGVAHIRKKFPERAFNVGVAEANMASIAAGLAAYGFIPFITTFTPFATRRICDQVTISIAYAKRNVKIVGADPGVAAEMNGGTHMSFEDVGVMRSIPGMVIFEPVDAVQLAKALPKLIEYDGPVYVRLFRKLSPVVFSDDYQFDLFKADLLREGRDITLFATGFLVKQALEAAAKLAEQGISAEVINVHTIKPVDVETVVASVRKTGAVVTCENHNVLGGLRSAIAEVTAEHCPVPLKPVGIQDSFGIAGTLAYLTKRFHLTTEQIVAKALECLEMKKGCAAQFVTAEKPVLQERQF